MTTWLQPLNVQSTTSRRQRLHYSGDVLRNLFNHLHQVRAGVSLLSFHHSGGEESLTSSVYTQALVYDFIHLNKSSKRKLNKNSTRIIQTFNSTWEMWSDKCNKESQNGMKYDKYLKKFDYFRNKTRHWMSGFGKCGVINIRFSGENCL